MKKLTGLDEKMLTIGEEEDNSKMPTRRTLLQMMGNGKAETADDARKTRRILTKLRDKTVTEIILENEDLSFMEKFFEKNQAQLPAWMHGQILDFIAEAEKVELKAV